MNILFIENDTYWFQQISSEFMLKPEFRIDISTNLLEAMSKVNTGGNVYNAVIININTIMQNADLAQVISSIKEKIPFAKVICVVEKNDSYQIVSLDQSGADGILHKPYSVDSLIAEIQKDVKTPFSQPKTTNTFSNNVKINNLSDIGQQNIGPQNYDTPNNNNQQVFGYNQNNNQYANNNQYVDNNQYVPQDVRGFINQNPQQNLQQSPQYGVQNFQGGGFQTQNEQSYQQPINQNFQGQNYRTGSVIRIPNNVTVAVHCPKGGVGKSSIAKELAVTYALSGVNGKNLKVCLVDMDIDYGDIAVMLELKQSKTISDWARNIRTRMGNMDESDVLFSYEEIEKYYLLQHRSGLKVLAAPTNYRDAALINEQIVRIVLNNLKKYFDVVIIDTGNNVKDFTVISMELSDHIVMICNTDVSTINEILTLRKTLEQIQFPMNKIGLLMNEVKKGDEVHISQISNFLGLPLLGEIPKTQAVITANNSGESLSMGRDNSFTISIKKIANIILPVVKRGNNDRATNSFQDKKTGFLKNIFSKINKKR